MNKKELKQKIENLETAWNYYHKDHVKYPMPDMCLLTKLRIDLERLERGEK